MAVENTQNGVEANKVFHIDTENGPVGVRRITSLSSTDLGGHLYFKTNIVETGDDFRDDFDDHNTLETVVSLKVGNKQRKVGVITFDGLTADIDFHWANKNKAFHEEVLNLLTVDNALYDYLIASNYFTHGLNTENIFEAFNYFTGSARDSVVNLRSNSDLTLAIIPVDNAKMSYSAVSWGAKVGQVTTEAFEDKILLEQLPQLVSDYIVEEKNFVKRSGTPEEAFEGLNLYKADAYLFVVKTIEGVQFYLVDLSNYNKSGWEY